MNDYSYKLNVINKDYGSITDFEHCIFENANKKLLLKSTH